MRPSSSLEDNNALLNRLKCGLRCSMQHGSASAPAPWVAAIMAWGGVYTFAKGQKGNKGWLRDNATQIRNLLADGAQRLQADDDDPSLFAGFRFNAGMSKVYSLLLDDFVIYDSRVAAGLGWLVCQWACENRVRPRIIPPHLAFGCPPPKGSKKRQVSPDFPVLWQAAINRGEYARWNLRANWVLSQAARVAGVDLRSVEAGLFMLGANPTPHLLHHCKVNCRAAGSR